MRIFVRTCLCSAVALMLVGCGSSKNNAAPPTGSSAPSASTTTGGGTSGGTPSSSSSTAADTTTTGGGEGGAPKSTGDFCADVRNGAVQNALLNAANPNDANNSFDQLLKKIDGEAPSQIKSDVDTMVQILTRVHDAGTASAKQAALAAASGQLATAATAFGNYITAHC